MKKHFLVNLIFILPILLADIFYIATDNIYIKTIASLLFVALGVINVILTHKKGERYLFSYILLAGLFFAFLGDVVLEIKFIVGAALFAIGHVFFFVSYCILQKFNLKDLIYGLSIFIAGALFILLAPIFNFDMLMKMVCLVYALVISLMLGKSIANVVKSTNKQNIIILIGSLLFFFSDLMLLIKVFTDITLLVGSINLFGLLCLLTYYPAEFLLAHSILYKGENTNENCEQ